LPLGIVGSLSRRRDPLTAADPIGAGFATTSSVRQAPGADVLVTFDDVRIGFGGVRALNGVSFEVAPGTVHGLIGPNGAGKTVLLNVLCGYHVPTSGTVRLAGRAITGVRPERIARLGIARTFQTTQLFGEMTVLENVLAGFSARIGRRFVDSLLMTPRLRREERERRAIAMAMLAFVGYPGSPEALGKSLPFGHQRLVEIARALILDPLLLAMDEPAAGLNPREVSELDTLIVRIRARGTAVLLVEHHMDLVMGISDRITVLEHGEKLAEGPPTAIRADARVVQAYLGEDDGLGG
jgi:branched-chain amino acid transport system permease protein